MPRFALVEITELELRPLKNEIFFIIPRFKANSSYCNKASNGSKHKQRHLHYKFIITSH